MTAVRDEWVRRDPRPGEAAAGRDKPVRIVMKRFVDATGQPCLVVHERRVVTLKSWRKWYKRTGAHEVSL